jgi:hypothetical protein
MPSADRASGARGELDRAENIRRLVDEIARQHHAARDRLLARRGIFMLDNHGALASASVIVVLLLGLVEVE